RAVPADAHRQLRVAQPDRAGGRRGEGGGGRRIIAARRGWSAWRRRPAWRRWSAWRRWPAWRGAAPPTPTRFTMASEPTAAPRPEARRAFAALHHPGYRFFLAGNVLTMTADNIEHVISYWVLHE